MNYRHLIALISLSITLLHGNTIYLAPATGTTASQDGSRRHPFSSLKAARDAIREARKQGDQSAWSIILAPGDYYLSETLEFEPQDSGTAAAPVLFRGAGTKTRILGGIPVLRWRAGSDGIWRAPVPSLPNGKPARFESLYVNDKRATRARHPNTGFFNPVAVAQTIKTNATTKAEYGIATLTLPSDATSPLAQTDPSDLYYAHLVVHHNWDTTRRIIQSYDPQSATITTRGGKWKHWNPWRTNSLFYVENLRSALDAPGEWFYDGKKLEILYIPRPGEKLPGTRGGVEAFAPCTGLDTLITFRGDPATTNFVSHITFENISFAFTDSPRRPSEVADHAIPPSMRDRHPLLPSLVDALSKQPGPTQFEPAQAASRTMAAIMADGTHNITFNQCTLRHTGEYGIWLRSGCVSNTINQCLLQDLGAGGIRIGSQTMHGLSIASNAIAEVTNYSTAFNKVNNCIIREGGRFHSSGTAIWIGHSSDNQITHCDIYDHYYTGISVGWVWGYRGSVAQRNTIAYNRISKIGQGALGDMGGIYTLGTSFGSHIHHNLIYDVDSYTYGGWGIYPDEGSEGLLIENNLVYDTKDASFHQHYGRNNTVRNNIFCCSRECQIAITRVEPHLSATFERNIIYWESGPAFSPRRYTNTTKAKTGWYQNLWWCAAGDFDFHGKSFAEWQAQGRDVKGIIADPLFVDPAARNFNFRETSNIDKISFRPFDITQAGVYGAKAWRRAALKP